MRSVKSWVGVSWRETLIFYHKSRYEQNLRFSQSVVVKDFSVSPLRILYRIMLLVNVVLNGTLDCYGLPCVYVILVIFKYYCVI